MDAAHQLMFALQSPVGLRFGATLQVDADRITFEMDLKIPKNTECSFRMELSGEDDTIMGRVKVERVLPQRAGSLPRYVCRVLDMPTEDRMRFDGWRRDLATGGVSRRLERDPEQLRAQISTKMMGGATEAESRAVLDRMNAKRSRLRKEEDHAGADLLGLATEQTGSVVDKANLREKLRDETPVDVVTQAEASAKAKEAELERAKAEMVKQMVVEETEAPSWMPPKTDEPAPPANIAKPTVEAVRPPVSAPRPKPTSAEGTRPVVRPPGSSPQKQSSPVSDTKADVDVSPPLIVVDTDASPMSITVIYLSDDSFKHDYDRTLHTSAITIDHPSLTDLYHAVSVTIQLADGANISTMGQMVALLPDGMAIALEFDSVQRAQLAQAAEQ